MADSTPRDAPPCDGGPLTLRREPGPPQPTVAPILVAVEFRESSSPRRASSARSRSRSRSSSSSSIEMRRDAPVGAVGSSSMGLSPDVGLLVDWADALGVGADERRAEEKTEVTEPQSRDMGRREVRRFVALDRGGPLGALSCVVDWSGRGGMDAALMLLPRNIDLFTTGGGAGASTGTGGRTRW